eukprot:9083233-Alexandrium_andersonii.AAC.1
MDTQCQDVPTTMPGNTISAPAGEIEPSRGSQNSKAALTDTLPDALTDTRTDSLAMTDDEEMQ